MYCLEWYEKYVGHEVEFGSMIDENECGIFAAFIHHKLMMMHNLSNHHKGAEIFMS